MASIGLALALPSLFGGITNAIVGSNAASTAANQESSAINQGIATEQPFLNAGSQSLGALLQGIQSGTFGSPSTFTAPTLEQAQATPGYEFANQEGAKGILEASAASGGAISGGTAKSLGQYETGLASSTYNTLFNQQLQGYGANLASNQQAYNQLLQPAQIGAGAGNNIAQLLTSLGQSQAAGTVGSANAITSGISGATNGITQAALLNSIFGSGGSTYNPNNTIATSLSSSIPSLAGSQILNGGNASLMAPINAGVGPG